MRILAAEFSTINGARGIGRTGGVLGRPRRTGAAPPSRRMITQALGRGGLAREASNVSPDGPFGRVRTRGLIAIALAQG